MLTYGSPLFKRFLQKRRGDDGGENDEIFDYIDELRNFKQLRG